jgi:DNA-binding NarL/FixJ family response regulator
VTSPIRVLCVDDHRLVLEGLSLILSRFPDMTVIGSAATGENAISMFREQRPDVTLMDLQLPTMSGLDAIKAIRREVPEAKIVVLTTYHGDEDIFRALQAGATTFLMKDMIADELANVIREVHAGTHTLTSKLRDRLSERASRPNLTPREIEVVGLIAEGMRNKEIAAALGITDDTVQAHVKSILVKLGVHDRTAAVRVALQRGIIHLES